MRLRTIQLMSTVVLWSHQRLTLPDIKFIEQSNRMLIIIIIIAPLNILFSHDRTSAHQDILLQLPWQRQTIDLGLRIVSKDLPNDPSALLSQGPRSL
jgi:hypothetical protein